MKDNNTSATCPGIDNLGLPPMAGIATYEEACRPGLSVDHNTDILRRYNYIKVRLVEIISAHISGTPEWEIKAGLSLHLWLDAEHSAMLRRRVGEMREPPLNLDKVPDERLKQCMDEALHGHNPLELIVAVYTVIRTELVEAYRRHLAVTNPLVDHPTVRAIRIILREEEEMVAWGKSVANTLTMRQLYEDKSDEWASHIRTFLMAAGGIDGTRSPATEPVPSPRSSVAPVDITPRRDSRFHDVFNTSETGQAVYQDKSKAVDERMFALIYKRLREMGVPEYLSAVIYRTPGKPWDYYVDLSRQVWDEARHALMGEAALYAHGVPFYKYPVNIHISTSLNKLDPLQVHTVLWGVEQALMPKNTGKHYEWEIAQGYGDPYCVTMQDYDWADEVLHAQIGRHWLLPELGSREKLDEFRKAAESRWNEEMAALRPLSSHAPWWPDFVAELRVKRRTPVA